MSEFPSRRLDEFISDGSMLLGRGDVISKEDIEAHPGPYPIYSSSAQNSGKFGEYGKFMFYEELITWSVDGGGGFFYRDKHRYSVTNVCGYMRLKSQELHPKFVYYSLANQHRFLIFDYTTKAHPSVIKKQYWLPTISTVHQQKIAAILTATDSAIEKTEALIAKYQQIKAGLMHDLFTRGVLPSGQLRPPREQAPELYQETSIGWIPREWQVKRLDDLAQVARGKFTHRPRNDPAYLGGPYPFIQTGEVSAAGGGIVSDSSQSLSALGTTVSQCFPEGTIAITIAANIADTAILGIPMYFPDSVVGAVVKEGCNVLFVELCVRKSKRRLDAMAPQSAQKNINLQDLRPLLIPQPDLLEQDRIAKRISAIESRIDVETKRRNKLSFKKLGLMQSLLTGKVPVTVKQPELADG
jgi:restriction endonuclease S subunit